ncbi:antitoxin [Streptomyces sp. NPDC006012]|uniref:antitoxin n=1 Tax=Streptomyces sp. NPDC006012 TaxID=3364739 RepID=UPI003675BE12
MSLMDKLKGMLKGHEDQASKGVDKAGDYVDERTGNKYQSQVDTAQQRMKDEMGGQDRDIPPHP